MEEIKSDEVSLDQKPQKSNPMIIIGIVILIIIAIYPTLTKNKTQTQEIPQPTTVASEKVAKEFVVMGSNYKFDVSEIKVKNGDTVKITFKNSEGMHDWVIDEFNSRTKVIKGGEMETVMFTVDKTGTFEYYCSVGQHRKNGMVGKLIVE